MNDNKQTEIYCVLGKQSVSIEALLEGYSSVNSVEKQKKSNRKTTVQDVVPEVTSPPISKTPWWRNALGLGLGAILTTLIFFYVPWAPLKIALLIGVIVFAFVLANNPVRRYMKGFYFVICSLFIAHGPSFYLKWIEKDTEVELGSVDPSFVFDLGATIIALTLLCLDYLERNKIFQKK